MNISSALVSGSSPRPEHKHTVSVAEPASKPVPAAPSNSRDRVELSEQKDSGAPSDRLGRLQDRLDQRLGSLLKNGELDERQIGAIEEAQAQFQGTLRRIGNALDTGGVGTDRLQKALGSAATQLSESVNAATAEPARSAPSETPETREDRRPETGNQIEGRLKRLGVAQQRIERRLSSLLESNELTERSSSAIAAAQSNFEGTLTRIGNALESGVSQDLLAKGFSQAVQELQSNVQSALQSEAPAPGSRRAPESSAGLAERISQLQKSVETRLSNLGGSDARSTGALGDAHDAFHAALDKLQESASGGASTSDLRSGFLDALNRLREDVQSALGGGAGKPVSIYSPAGEQSPLDTANFSGLDRTA